MSTEKNKVPATIWYRKKRTWIIASGVGFLFILILISLPYGIQFGLADFLKQHGARQVEIQNIDFNPFTGRLLFQQVTAASADGEQLTLDHLALDFGWRDLFSKRARIEAIDMQGLEASLDLSDPANLRVSGLSFPLGGTEGTPAEKPADEAAPWGFALDSVELRACALKLKQRDLALAIELEQLSLHRVISWQLQQAAELSLKGRLNSAPFSAEVTAVLFDETREIKGKLDLQALDLAVLQPLLNEAEGPEVAGKLGLAQRFELTLNPAGALEWEADGMLQGEKLDAAAAPYRGSGIASRWQGKSSGGWSGQEGLTLRLEGQLEGALPQFQLPEQGMDLSLAGYRWEGSFGLEQGDAGLMLQTEGAFALDEAVVAQAKAQPARVSVRRIGLQALTLKLQQRAEGEITLNQQGELSLEGLALLQHGLLAELASLQWGGEFSLHPAAEGPQITASGGGATEGLKLVEKQSGDSLVRLQRIDMADLALAPGIALNLASLGLQGIELGVSPADKQPPMLQSQSLGLRDIHFSQANGLSIGQVEQQGLQASLVLDKEGGLNLQGLADRLQAAVVPGERGEPASSDKVPQEKPMPVKIDRLVLTGKNHATFSDLSVQPPFLMELDVKAFELSGVDSSRPLQPSPFRFVGSTGRHAEITAEGELTLFQSDPDGKVSSQLKGVEMVPLSSYTVPAIGYRLDSGELDAEIELALKQGNMEGNNHLIIRRMDVSQASAAQAEKLEAQIAMPLDTALGMLQDKHQTIDLNLPVSGKLSDPNVELGDVINTALGNALKKGAMTYLTTALFPYGTMVALLKMAGEEAGAVQLTPVEFPPAAASLDDKDRDYLSKVAQVLEERPQIAIKLCGMATQADRQAMIEALQAEQSTKEDPEKASDGQAKEGAAAEPPQIPDEQLTGLARSRAEAVEDYLVKQHGVSPGRAAVCRPEIDNDKKALPRVDLQI